MKEGTIDIGELVAWHRHKDKNGRDYFVIIRRGYPPCVRRILPTRKDLIRIYRNDTVIRL